MGIKKNFAYSSLLTVSSFLFPMLTYPYVSRVLGVTNIGICNFIDSIINYFILFSSMGINVVGIREIAKAKGDVLRLSKVFSALWILMACMTSLMLLCLLMVTIFVPQLNEYASLMMIGACKLIANLFLIEWFYRGIEEFKYITYRSLLVKIIYVACIFLFIHHPADYSIYYILSVLLIVLNAFFNIFYSRKFIRFIWDKNVLDEYKRSFFILGIYVTEVGYYTTATKLHGIILAFFTAFTGVMLPRMSALVAENRIDEVKRLINKSFDLLFMISVPLIVFSIYFAPEIIYLISGNGYEGAITPMRMVMPLVLIIGMEQILIVQLLMPLKKDHFILINSIIGACVGMVANVLLVPTWAAKGSAIVWVLAEVAVLLSASYFLRKQIDSLYVIGKKLLLALFQSLPYVLVCWFVTCVEDNIGIVLFYTFLGFLLIFYLENFEFVSIKIDAIKKK